MLEVEAVPVPARIAPQLLAQAKQHNSAALGYTGGGFVVREWWCGWCVGWRCRMRGLVRTFHNPANLPPLTIESIPGPTLDVESGLRNTLDPGGGRRTDDY